MAAPVLKRTNGFYGSSEATKAQIELQTHEFLEDLDRRINDLSALFRNLSSVNQISDPATI